MLHNFIRQDSYRAFFFAFDLNIAFKLKPAHLTCLANSKAILLLRE